MSLLFKHRIWILLALAVVMAATRMSHFGTSALLPDASLAVFLLAGVMGLSVGCLGLLMAAAFGLGAMLLTYPLAVISQISAELANETRNYCTKHFGAAEFPSVLDLSTRDLYFYPTTPVWG